jgi:hypothetical protein
MSAVRVVQMGDGARPDNMAPSNPISVLSGVRVLQQGIDSIWLNVYGSLREDVALCLDLAKENAQASEEGDWSLSPLPPFDGTTPLVHASGVRYYDWHCRSEDITVTLRKPGRSPLPAAVVRVSAQALWRLGGGGRQAVELAGDYLRPLFEEGSYEVRVKRVDLATDFQGWAPGVGDLAGVVRRADSLDVHWGEGDAIETIAAGRSKVVRVSLYHKSLQVRKAGLGWVESKWSAVEGYVPSLPVWRLEYQFGREFLHERKVEALADLWPVLPALWAYGVGWFSVRTPNPGDPDHRERWTITPAWQALSTWRDEASEKLPKVAVVRPKLRRLCAGGVGYLTSVMAVLETLDPAEALEKMIAVVRAKKGVEGLERVLAYKQARYAGFTMGAG